MFSKDKEENIIMEKVFFFGVSNNESENDRYSNFVYSLCKYNLEKKGSNNYDVESFSRHDLIDTELDIKESIYNHISEYDEFVFLLDEMGSEYNDIKYNPNVWFELGLVSSSDKKGIVLLSRTNNLPFYVSSIQPVLIGKNIYDCFLKHKDEFAANKDWEKSIERIIEDSEQNSTLKKEIINFGNSLMKKLGRKNNPFNINNYNSDIKAVGFGSVYDLLSSMNISKTVVIADFITNEKEAFEALTDAVSNAKISLMTTRFANRSITIGERSNSVVHGRFMDELCHRSKVLTDEGKTSDRIICNNNFRKWHDIYQALLRGGNIKVYIRKENYSIGYELVIVDAQTTFIHFYQLSTIGNSNSDGSANEPKNEVINSTLRINDKDVSKKMVDVFNRLHHRNWGIPSRTLIGIPIEDKDYGEYTKKIKKGEENYGIFCFNKRNEEDAERSNRIITEFFNKIELWNEYLSSTDRFNMLFGIMMVANKYIHVSEKQINKLKEIVSLEKDLFKNNVKKEYENSDDPDEKKNIEKACRQLEIELNKEG